MNPGFRNSAHFREESNRSFRREREGEREIEIIQRGERGSREEDGLGTNTSGANFATGKKSWGMG